LVCYGKTRPRRFFNFLSQNSLIKSMQIPNNPLRSSQYSNTHSPKHLPNLRMSWCNHNLERNRRPSRKPIILFQIDRLPGSSAIAKAQSIREMASQISRPATIMPGQIRRLERRISTFAPGCRNGLGERTLRRTSNDLARMDRPGLRSRLR
jgi:hypothetical protein